MVITINQNLSSSYVKIKLINNEMKKLYNTIDHMTSSIMEVLELISVKIVNTLDVLDVHVVLVNRQNERHVDQL